MWEVLEIISFTLQPERTFIPHFRGSKFIHCNPSRWNVGRILLFCAVTPKLWWYYLPYFSDSIVYERFLALLNTLYPAQHYSRVSKTFGRAYNSSLRASVTLEISLAKRSAESSSNLSRFIGKLVSLKSGS